MLRAVLSSHRRWAAISSVLSSGRRRIGRRFGFFGMNAPLGSWRRFRLVSCQLETPWLERTKPGAARPASEVTVTVVSGTNGSIPRAVARSSPSSRPGGRRGAGTGPSPPARTPSRRPSTSSCPSGRTRRRHHHRRRSHHRSCTRRPAVATATAVPTATAATAGLWDARQSAQRDGSFSKPFDAWNSYSPAVNTNDWPQSRHVRTRSA